MRKYLRSGFPTLLFLFLAVPCLSALEVPKKPDGYVTDRAGILPASAKAGLETVLRAFEEKTSNQIVVATFPSLEGSSLEDFSMRLAEAWKAGQKGRDNGIIFLIFPEDRKMRIEVGYGLEGVLPDALAGQIISGVVAPYFRKGDYSGGILAGTDAILKAAQGEFKGADPTAEWMGRRMKAFWVFFSIFFLMVFGVDFVRYHHYTFQNRLFKKRYDFWEWWGRFAILCAILSICFRVLFYALLSSRSYGSGGGSGSFGGGFSGGGGGFGGGGASGGW